jgi:hypothetical protein
MPITKINFNEIQNVSQTASGINYDSPVFFSDQVSINDNTLISGTLNTTGNNTFNGNINVSGVLTSSGNVVFNENVTINKNLIIPTSTPLILQNGSIWLT